MYSSSQIFNLTNYSYHPYALPNLFATLYLSIMGLFVLLKKRRAIVNILFFLICLSAIIWQLGFALVYSSINKDVALFWVRFVYIGVCVISANIYAFSVICLKLKRQLKFVVVSYVLSSAFLAVSRADFFISTVDKYPWGYYTRAGFLHHPFLVFFLLTFLAGLYNFYKEYKKETMPLEKERKKYMFIAFLLASAGCCDFLAAYRIPVYPFGYIPTILFLSIFAYAIARYRLMDIETMIHRAITYILLAILIVLPYAAVLTLVRFSLKGEPEIWEVLLGSFLVALSLFIIIPLKEELQRVVDRVFYKDKYDYRRVLEKFAEELSLFLDSPDLMATIIKTISGTMHVDQVFIMLFDEKTGKYVVGQRNIFGSNGITIGRDSPFVQRLELRGDVIEREPLIADPGFQEVKEEGLRIFDSLGAQLIVPLIVEGKLIGILSVGKKVSGDSYKIEDTKLLSGIGRQVAMAINNRLLFEELKSANQELKTAQAQLVQSAKMAAVGQLGAGVAHELNNPLGGILGYAQFMLEKFKRPEFGVNELQSCLRYVEFIERESSRCKNIVENLLKFSRQTLSARLESISIARAIEETLLIIGHQLKLKNVNLITDFRAGLCEVKAVANQLQQVFTNLVLNAQQAMSEGGELKVSAENIIDENTGVPKWVKIEFSDSGCGIPEENLARVFEPFFTTKEKERGIGLGLAVSYQIIQEHKGTIAVKSQVGKGATFTICLPAIVKK